jgi:hypothetical protein
LPHGFTTEYTEYTENNPGNQMAIGPFKVGSLLAAT